jgi:hypothetical protein
VWSIAGDHRDADSHRPSLVRCVQAVHDDFVTAVSLAAHDHMGDYDGTASPQV